MHTIENLYEPNCIRTYTGQYVNVFNPEADTINIEDIAHALSNQCRFGGHLPKMYTVAQHCVYVSRNVFHEHKLGGLLHDASEAYLMDIPSPIKKGLSNYREIEDGLMHCIAKKFGFYYPNNEMIKNLDEYMLRWEWSSLMLGEGIFPPIQCWSNKEAEEQFLNTFKAIK